MLYIGEKVGNPEAAVEVDIAVDPLEGTNLVATGSANATAVLAAAEPGGLLHAPDTYMRKLIVGPQVVGHVSINDPVEATIRTIAERLGRGPWDITVVILDRPRHEQLIADVRATGARIKLISDGDLTAGISVAVSGTGVHAVMGIGGAPEGVLTAAALKCLGGEIQGTFAWRSKEERERARNMGVDVDDTERVYFTNDLASGEEVVFSATGVTDGELLQGVRFFGGGARTHSLLMSYKRGDRPLHRHGPHLRPRPPAQGPALGGPTRQTALALVGLSRSRWMRSETSPSSNGLVLTWTSAICSRSRARFLSSHTSAVHRMIGTSHQAADATEPG